MPTGITYFNAKRRIGKTERKIREYIQSLNERLKQQNIPIFITVKKEKIDDGVRLWIYVKGNESEELKGKTESIANWLKGYTLRFNTFFKDDKLPALVHVKKEESDNGYRLYVEIKMEEELIEYAKELEEKKKMEKELKQS